MKRLFPIIIGIFTTILFVVVLSCAQTDSNGGGDSNNGNGGSETVTFQSVLPAHNSVDVSIDTKINIKFSSNLDQTTKGTVKLGSKTFSNSEIAISGDTIIVTPNPKLSHETSYTGLHVFGFKDSKGNAIDEHKNDTYTFKTIKSTVNPMVVTFSSVIPAKNAVDVSIDSKIEITFSGELDFTVIGTVKLGTKTFSGTEIAIHGSKAIVTPNPALSYNTTYTGLTVSGFKDTSSNVIAEYKDDAYNFKTKVDPSDLNIVFYSVEPASGTGGVAIDSRIKITFSGNLNSSDKGTVKLNGHTYSASEIAIVGSVVTVTPSSPFVYATTYTGLEVSGFKSYLNNTIAPYTDPAYTFTTAANPLSTTANFLSITPATGSTNVAISSKIHIYFTGNLNTTKGSVKIGTRTFSASEMSISGDTVTITPATKLTYDTTYTGLEISGFESTTNALMTQVNNPAYSFKTCKEAKIASVTPVSGSINVLTDTNIVITMDSALDASTKGTVTVGTKTFSASEISISDKVITINPTTDFSYDTTYTGISITGFKSSLGDTVADSQPAYNFKTCIETKINSVDPVAGSTDIPANYKVKITFSTPLDSVKGNIKIGTRVINESEISISGSVVTITADPIYIYDTTYSGLIVSGFKGTNGVIMTAYNNGAYSFKTAAKTEVTSVTPASNSTNVATTATIQVVFNGNLNSATKGSVTIGTKTFSGTEISISNNIVTATPSAALDPETTYTGIIVSGFKDTNGLMIDTYTNSSYNFKTQGAPLGGKHPSSGAFSPVSESSWATASYALGANYSGTDVEFAVYSKNGTKVLLEIYDQKSGVDAKYDYWMEKKLTDNIWRAKLKDVPAGTLYAFRVWGPNWQYSSSWTRGNSAVGFTEDFDSNGNRFNPNKVLFDPYAKEISHDKSNPTTLGTMDGNIFGTGPTLYKTIARRNYDTGKYAPKSVVVKDSTSFGTKPDIAQKDAIIYEAHVRGLSNHPSTANLSTILSTVGITAENIPSQYRGTYKGATYLIPYLKAIGINTIEFVPVHETDNDGNPDDAPGGNYWGYMTYGYFAPDRRYSSDKSYGGPTREFKEMVAAFHAAGMEVYLDVVYNHSGEGGTWGTTDPAKVSDGYKPENILTTEITFLRGFDNSEYYSLVPANKGNFWETTGCGNNLRCDNPPVRNFIKDSLNYWIDVMGVDGFRFDLAPVLGRVSDGVNWPFSATAQTITDIATIGTTKKVEMIAEAWDCDWPGGYQVSNFPNHWGEWNGRFRDATRRFMKGSDININDPVHYDSITDFIHGDWKGFNDQGGPHKSVNFITAHDGFTLADLVSYNSRDNSAARNGGWPFGPSDGGSGDNDSWDHSIGTPAANQALRRQQIKNFLTFLMFSRGVPMIVWGDEFGRTQNGNNNPYNIDSVATWSNYNQINTDSPQAVATGGGGTYHNNIGTDAHADGKNSIFLFAKNVMNLRANDPTLRTADYSTTNYGYDGSGFQRIVNITGANKYKVYINSSHLKWTNPPALTAADTGKKWVRLIDTQTYFETNDNFWSEDSAGTIVTGDVYGVEPRSIVVLKMVSTSGSTTTSTTSTSTTSTTSTTTTTIGGGGSLVAPTFSFAGASSKAYVVKGNRSLTISSTTAGAVIYYTVDGTDPKTSITRVGPSSGNSVTVSLTSTGGAYGKGGYDIKAVAYKDSAYTSVINDRYAVSSTYTIPDINSSGVMLQAFGWGSAKRELVETPVHYANLTAKASEIQNFEWVWMPPPQDTLCMNRESATAATGHQGYMPRELFKFSNNYGTLAEHQAALNAIKGGPNNTKLIADIVINHRVGMSSDPFDFQNPVWGSNQVVPENDAHPPTSWGGPGTGWNDTGNQFPSARDIDHTDPLVQKDILEMMRLLKVMGYSGWRYDYVHGIAGEYFGYYNAMSETLFSVGEYWKAPDTVDQLSGWITKTSNAGARSMAFDFALKTPLTNSFSNLASLASNGKQNGLVGSYPEDAVTFLDNHDTGSSQNHWPMDGANVHLGYVYILTQSGIPCVFYEHYFDWNNATDIANIGSSGKGMKAHINELMRIRKAAGVTNKSTVTVQSTSGTLYSAKVGDNLYMKIGSGSYTPSGVAGWSTYSGNNFSVWYRDAVPTVTLSGTTNFGTVVGSATETKTFTISNTTASSFDTMGKINLSGTGYTMTAVTPTVIPSGSSGTFTVTFSGDSLADNTYTGTLSVTGYNSLNLTAVKSAVALPTTVTLTVNYGTNTGQSIYFAGNFQESNNWTKAVRGYWTDGHNWKCDVTLSGELSALEWKPIVISPDTSAMLTPIPTNGIGGYSVKWSADPNNIGTVTGVWRN